MDHRATEIPHYTEGDKAVGGRAEDCHDEQGSWTIAAQRPPLVHSTLESGKLAHLKALKEVSRRSRNRGAQPASIQDYDSSDCGAAVARDDRTGATLPQCPDQRILETLKVNCF